LDEPPGYTVALLSSINEPFTLETLGFVVMAVLGLVWLSIAITEAAFFTLSAEDLSKIIQGRKRWQRSLMTLMNYPQHIQVANLFLKNMIKVTIITCMIIFVHATDHTWLWLFLFLLFISLMVLMGDIAAKKIGTKNRHTILEWTATILKVLTFCLMPISKPFLWLQGVLVKVFGMRRKASEKAASKMLNETLNEVMKNSDEQEVMKSMSNFGSISVRQLMRARKDVIAMDVDGDFSTLIDVINRSGFSRIPAYRSTLDTIEGMVYIKDLIPFIDQQKGFEWQKLIRPAFFVSESTRISVLLKDFQQKHVHIAMVLDKYGRVVGLITLHDLIEEVIDDINEEFNPVTPPS
jgi:CBS domain containing-hemolysin-like protein